jgi:hypothetical protein
MEDAPEAWMSVCTFLDLKEAEIACGLLRSEGIACYLQGAEHRSLLGFLGPYIQPRLMVRKESYARALELLAPEETGDARPTGALGSDAKEAADLDLLVVNFVEMTLFTLGARAPRSELERLVGPPTAELADDEGGHELRFRELGSIVFLDSDHRMNGFFVVADPAAEEHDLDEFPGFWEPGATLRPPSYATLVAALGAPSHDDERPNDGRYVEWVSDRAAVYALLASNTVTEFEVEFLEEPR